MPRRIHFSDFWGWEGMMATRAVLALFLIGGSVAFTLLLARTGLSTATVAVAAVTGVALCVAAVVELRDGV